MSLIKKSLCLGLVITCCNTQAADMQGRVVRVIDGDTLVVLDRSNTQLRVRLSEIDAPEKHQAFGQVSSDHLSHICFGQNAIIKTHGLDLHGRILGHVYCNGINANISQLETGYAWAYRQYVQDPTIYQYETDARINKRGLWVDTNPTPPWEFRHSKASNQ